MTVLAYEIMTPSIKAVPQSWTMDRLARFLTDNEITGSPVTDDDGEIVGIATLKDITEFRWNANFKLKKSTVTILNNRKKMKLAGKFIQNPKQRKLFWQYMKI